MQLQRLKWLNSFCPVITASIASWHPSLPNLSGASLDTREMLHIHASYGHISKEHLPCQHECKVRKWELWTMADIDYIIWKCINRVFVISWNGTLVGYIGYLCFTATFKKEPTNWQNRIRAITHDYCRFLSVKTVCNNSMVQLVYFTETWQSTFRLIVRSWVWQIHEWVGI